jgi:hypothetical protein
MQDVRYAVRVLTKAPAFTGTVFVTLALGIGANTAVFSVLNALALRLLPVPHADELFLIDLQGPASVPQRFSYRMFDGLRSVMPRRDDLAAMSRVATMHGVVEPARDWGFGLRSARSRWRSSDGSGRIAPAGRVGAGSRSAPRVRCDAPRCLDSVRRDSRRRDNDRRIDDRASGRSKPGCVPSGVAGFARRSD